MTLACRLADLDRLRGAFRPAIEARQLNLGPQRLLALRNRQLQFPLRLFGPIEVEGDDRLQDADIDLIRILPAQIRQGRGELLELLCPRVITLSYRQVDRRPDTKQPQGEIRRAQGRRHVGGVHRFLPVPQLGVLPCQLPRRLLVLRVQPVVLDEGLHGPPRLARPIVRLRQQPPQSRIGIVVPDHRLQGLDDRIRSVLGPRHQGLQPRHPPRRFGGALLGTQKAQVLVERPSCLRDSAGRHVKRDRGRQDLRPVPLVRQRFQCFIGLGGSLGGHSLPRCQFRSEEEPRDGPVTEIEEMLLHFLRRQLVHRLQFGRRTVQFAVGDPFRTQDETDAGVVRALRIGGLEVLTGQAPASPTGPARSSSADRPSDAETAPG